MHNISKGGKWHSLYLTVGHKSSVTTHNGLRHLMGRIGVWQKTNTFESLSLADHLVDVISPFIPSHRLREHCFPVPDLRISHVAHKSSLGQGSQLIIMQSACGLGGHALPMKPSKDETCVVLLPILMINLVLILGDVSCHKCYFPIMIHFVFTRKFMQSEFIIVETNNRPVDDG